MIKKIVFAMILAIFFTGCGGGGASSSVDTAPTEQEKPADIVNSPESLPPVPQIPKG